MQKIIETNYQKALDVLEHNSSNKIGFLASAPSTRARQRNYLSVFARDASISSLGALASGDKKLISKVKKSIETLAKGQSYNGQIPNYVRLLDKRFDFWRIDCIDSTPWWLLILKKYEIATGDEKLTKKLQPNIDKAILWMMCREHSEDRLLVQNEASDWADLMPRTGKVLYSNVLWLYVKKLYKIKSYTESKKNFDNAFYPFNKDAKKVKKCVRTTVEAVQEEIKEKDYFLSFVNYLFWGRDIDVYANSLAIILGLADKKFSNQILDKCLAKRKKKKLPMPVMFNPIKRTDKIWRPYMDSHNGQNKPYQYHNGGIWTYTACFFVIALAKAGRKKEAWEELEKIAEQNKNHRWEFNEWFHAHTDKAHGMQNQTWNAGAFVLAYEYLKGNFKF